MTARPTLLIAEDEPLLAQALKAELTKAWPEVEIVGLAGTGRLAVKQGLELAPDVLFFDIRMPGLTGLEAAAELADAWPPEHAPGKPFPVLVFVTAYDQYAVQAFEAQAIDYVLKPVQADRLARTVARVQQTLAARDAGEAEAGAADEASAPAPVAGLDDAVRQLRALLQQTGLAEPGAPAPQPLKVFQCSVGNSIRMVPVAEVLYLEAADKYVRVLTADHEYLVRTPLKDLLPQLDATEFWQIHRGTVVRAQAIDAVTRDESGKLSLTLHGRPDKLVVSRLYGHLFKAM
jgi:DNA-binding LytR/AlgR family response regulator